MRILVADDDRVGAKILTTTLQRWEFEVTHVADGAEAWAALQRDPMDPMLAILDRMMPSMDGTEVCRRVRAELPNANRYLILLTSLDRRGDVVAGLQAGADDYITKPFDPEELRARVQVGVRLLTLQERLAERVAELQTALKSVKQLQGLLPICSYCKRIRGDNQYWTQVESYIVDHSDAQFSHGICPACYVKLEEQLESYQRDKRQEKQ